MDLGLKGKVVVITGTAGIRRSIGETIVQALAEEGAIPVIYFGYFFMSLPANLFIRKYN